MNKKELVRSVSKKAKVSLKDAELYLNAVTECISEGLKKNDSVKIVGFGAFKKTFVNVTEGINPSTQERIKVSPYTRITFSAGKKFKAIINVKKRTKKAATKKTATKNKKKKNK